KGAAGPETAQIATITTSMSRPFKSPHKKPVHQSPMYFFAQFLIASVHDLGRIQSRNAWPLWLPEAARRSPSDVTAAWFDAACDAASCFLAWNCPAWPC